MAKTKARNPARSRTAEFSPAERLLMLLENSSAARWAGLAIISVPSLLVVGLFWWNVRAQDVAYADRRASVAPAPVAVVAAEKPRVDFASSPATPEIIAPPSSTGKTVCYWVAMNSSSITRA